MHRAYNSSQSGSQSPQHTPSPSSTSRTPSLPAMVPVPDDINSSSRSVRSTPNHQSIDLPRIPSASKGGCWTCRLRRKKCDEQREGDSCHTCLRLTIECLGWGTKRPEWMRDKQAVEAYKAKIKAQLTRAGLIRGQPRSSLPRTNSIPAVPPQLHPVTYHRPSIPDPSTSSPRHFDHPEYNYNYVNPVQRPHHAERQDHNLIPTIPGSLTSGFHQLPDYSDPALNGLDLHPPFFQYPQPVTPISSSSDSLNLDISQLRGSQDPGGFDFDLQPPSPLAPLPFIIGQNNVQDHIMYYFEHVRRIQLIFAGNTFTNATYSLIVQEPTGAVTNAVCALASLHFTGIRVAEGLEAPDPNPEHSNAKYFHDEAYFHLNTARHLRHTSESDALAALHLIYFSQLSGGATDWQPAFQIMCDWLATTGLLTEENPAISLRALSTTTQLLVRATIWLDTFSSVALTRPPKYLGLMRRLLGEQGGFWQAGGDSEELHSLRMDLVTGCPDEAMLAFAEVAMLAHWKATEQRNKTLSYRELMRRGDDIEGRLRQHHSIVINPSDLDQVPLHPNLPQTGVVDEAGVAPFPDEKSRSIVARIFCEAAVLLLNITLNNANPGVVEIHESVERVVQLLDQLMASRVDRALVFPICLAGSMSNDSGRRDLCKGRLQHLDGSIGSLMKIRLVMEAVWQKRDATGETVDFREMIHERALNLILI